jgi:hypothetical protein
MRTVVDYDVDRLGVEERQRSELTSTNRPIGLAMTFEVAFVRPMGQALRRNPRMRGGLVESKVSVEKPQSPTSE